MWQAVQDETSESVRAMRFEARTLAHQLADLITAGDEELERLRETKQ